MKRLAAVAVAATLLLGACSGNHQPAQRSSGSASRTATASPSTSGTPASSTPSAAAAVPAALQGFYTQKLAWKACGDGFECARLRVPVDYAAPGGATTQVSVIRLPVKNRSKRIGSLLLNPGGPGGSGIQYARAADTVVSDAVRARYDVVGFDPRGVGESSPVNCLDDKGTDQLLAADPTPDTPAEEQAILALDRHLGQACKLHGGALLGHISTRDVARDLDVLRAVLGDKKLTYLGKSYGTFIGATYADLFPTHVGRMVLDGALDPRSSTDSVNLGQAKGFELATRQFVTDCLKQGGCPLKGSVDNGMQQIRALMTRLDRAPLKTSDPKRRLTEGLGALGLAVAMYDQGYWPILRIALSTAFAGNGDQLMALADIYADRGQDGHYSSNQNTVIYAVNCLDRSANGDLATIRRTAAAFAKQAPTFGRYLAWSSVPCATWPIPAQDKPHAITAPGSPPIVVVGTTRDPATPYPWAVGLAAQLSKGHLITYEGDGHTAYRRGSQCVDSAVDAYLLQGKVPADKLRCR